LLINLLLWLTDREVGIQTGIRNREVQLAVMRRHTQRVPTDLPHARLYLDDIEEVTRILSEEVSQAVIHAPERAIDVLTKENLTTAPATKVLYQIGKEEMDSIDDLLNQGGSVSDLEVSVSNTGSHWPHCEIRFHWASTPSLNLSGFGDN
jgi:hypothetical protein